MSRLPFSYAVFGSAFTTERVSILGQNPYPKISSGLGFIQVVWEETSLVTSKKSTSTTYCMLYYETQDTHQTQLSVCCDHATRIIGVLVLLPPCPAIRWHTSGLATSPRNRIVMVTITTALPLGEQSVAFGAFANPTQDAL